MHPGIIVQARMGSSRFPGKVMELLHSTPVVGWVADRLGPYHWLEANVTLPETDEGSPLHEYLKGKNWIVHFGPEDDVAERFRRVVEKRGLGAFARICADSPFIDPHLVDVCLALVVECGVDFVACRNLPHGQLVQAIKSSVFLEHLPKFDAHDREHVLSYFYTCPDVTRVYLDAENIPDNQLVVDTPADLERCRALAKKYGGHVPLGFANIQ